MDWFEKAKLIPLGYSKVIYKGAKYGVTRTDFNKGKSIKVYAKQLGGKFFISFNYYSTGKANVLKPCEMPQAVVIHFLQNFVLVQEL